MEIRVPTVPPGPIAALLQKLKAGKEKKLGRSLEPSEAGALESYAKSASDAGVAPADQRSPLEAARAAVRNLPKRLPEAGLPRRLPGRRNPKGARLRAGRAIEDVGVLLRMAVRDGRRGPQLPAYARRTSALYVQQDDLEPLIPDGWGATFRGEAGALGREMGLPPRAIPLLCLLEWTASFRPALRRDVNECGTGLQVSLEWLARKLGCTRVWVQALLNRLDPYAAWRRECLETKRLNRRRAKYGGELVPMPTKPTGVAYIHRFRRLKRYEDTCPEAAKRRIWIDAKGKPHLYVDVRGVCYLTSAGRKVLGRSRRGLEASHEVSWRGRRTRWILAARLRRGHDLFQGGHIHEVLENRSELLAAPGVPQNLRPNHSSLLTPQLK